MRRAFLGVMLAGLAGCGGCRRTVAAVTQTVPRDVVAVEVPRYLANNAQIAVTLCGLPLSGLVNVEVVSFDTGPVNPDATNRTLSFVPGAHVQIRATPADPNAPPMRCEGRLELGFRHEAAVWTIISALVVGVQTPGVQFTPPPGRGGRHHRHHH